MADPEQEHSSPPTLNIEVQPAEKHYEPPGAYKNLSEPRGRVFIGNYVNFDKKTGLKTRTGSEVDVIHLRQLFTQMNYQVDEGIQDGTRENTLEALETFRDLEIHSRVDSCVVIFMSHGREDEFRTSDGQRINYKDVCRMFSNDNCPALRGKPKIFMFQFCRNNCNGHSYVPIDSTGNSHQSRQNRGMSDVYICFATTQGFVCLLNVRHGAFLINEVCEVFMEHAKDKEFDYLMKKVERNLQEHQTSEVIKIGVKNDFYFNPPMKRESKGKCFSNAVNDHDDSPMQVVTDSEQTSACKIETDDTYKIPNTPRGLVLIINNLSGCKEDVNKLRDMFGQLGYKVLVPLSNIPYDKMMEELDNFKQENHHDSAIVIFYGHGFEDCIVSYDDVAIKFKELTKLFNNRNCPKLAGKPKIFIFNTCFTDSSKNSESGVQDVVTAPEAADKDMIILSVEVDGGQCENGSLLTQALCEVLLSPKSITKELSPLLRLVSKNLGELSGEDNTEQYFVDISSIRFQKEFFFSLSNPDTVDGAHSPVKPMERAGTYRSEKINIKEAKQLNITYPRGQAIIIGYTINNYDWRKKDIMMYKELFEKLGYTTKVYHNLTLEEVKVTLQVFKDMKEHNKSDSTIVIVLGEAGDVNNFYDKSGQLMPVADIYSNFTDEKCPSLKTKPKLFFFHMTEHEKWSCTSITPPDENLKDVLSLYLISTVQKNNKHPVEGLRTLCKAIESCAHNTHFENIINRAEVDLLSKDPGNSERFIKRRIRFTNDFYFNRKRVKQ